MELFKVIALLPVWIFCAVKKKFGKPEGAIMLHAYAAYAAYICLR